MNGSHSQCMQLIFSGIRFEDLKEVTALFQDSDTVMAKQCLRHSEIEKKIKSTPQKQQVRSLASHTENYLVINILISFSGFMGVLLLKRVILPT